MIVDFKKFPSHIEEVFQLIRQVPCGEQILSLFNCFYRKKVKLEPYPVELLIRLRLELDASQATGACFVHDGSTGTIYYDPHTSLGILGPFLIHELVHATDPNLWKVPELPKNSSQRKAILLETELRAFRTQQNWIAGLKKLDPSYSLFIDEVKNHMRILAEDLSAEEIQTLYGFKH